MAKAKFIKNVNGFTGDAKLYKVNPPTKYNDTHKTSYIIVSATMAMFSGAETYIFPANKEGEIIDWGALDGSFQGGLDHRQALMNAGYKIT